MEQHILSTLDSIIPKDQAPWNKLDAGTLVQLHRKFWGVNMQDEENNWRATQPAHDAMAVDVDENAEDGGEDETGSGCYILTLDIPSIDSSPLWVRKEYIRMFDFCEAYLSSFRSGKIPSVVVTGQPGIGKSYWTYYALRRCLAQRKPVMWSRAPALFLFVEEGVYQSPADYFPTELKTRVWTLIDSDDSPDGIPHNLAVHNTKHFIICSSSPQPRRWGSLKKTTRCTIAIMNPWSKKEISKAAGIHGLDDDKRVYEHYDEYGPTPRICFDFLKPTGEFNMHKQSLKGALQELSLEVLRKMITDIDGFKMETISHTLLLVKRAPKDPCESDAANWSSMSVEPITHFIAERFRVQVWKRTRAEQLDLYHYLATVKSSRPVAGLVFESLAQSKLQNGSELVLVPMVKKETGGSGQGKKLPRWHSNHGDGVNPSSVRQINVTPARTVAYSNLDRIEDGVYYVPESRNQVAFDAFILANGELFIFQFSIGSNHPIKEGIVPFFAQYSLPPRANWHFVFVVPNVPASEICCPQTRDPSLKALLDEMDLSSAVLNPI